MPEWLARLSGDADDLRLLSEHLLSNDPSVKEEEDAYWLRYSVFDSLTEPTDVYESVIKLLREIRGVAMLLSGGALEVEVVSLAQENYVGPRPQYVFSKGIPSAERFGMSTTTFTQMIAIAERNPSIAKALGYYQRGDWFNLYKAWEAVREGTNGRSNGWTSDKVRNRFTNTVNNPEAIGDDARHGVRTGEPPPKPMAIEEAREYVGRLIRTWIKEEA